MLKDMDLKTGIFRLKVHSISSIIHQFDYEIKMKNTLKKCVASNGYFNYFTK
jgi:hypothetical protein